MVAEGVGEVGVHRPSHPRKDKPGKSRACRYVTLTQSKSGKHEQVCPG